MKNLSIPGGSSVPHPNIINDDVPCELIAIEDLVPAKLDVLAGLLRKVLMEMKAVRSPSVI